MEIVPVDKIPIAGETPTDNLEQIFEICSQMESLCKDLDGVGMAAVQVGIPWKLFIVRFDAFIAENSEFRYFLNCEYSPTEKSGTLRSQEGCLSLRDKQGNLQEFHVPRHESVRITGQRLVRTDAGFELKPVDLVVSKFLGIKFQHEIDHTRQILISDIGTEILRKR